MHNPTTLDELKQWQSITDSILELKKDNLTKLKSIHNSLQNLLERQIESPTAISTYQKLIIPNLESITSLEAEITEIERRRKLLNNESIINMNSEEFQNYLNKG
jgi:hypothetical protein